MADAIGSPPQPLQSIVPAYAYQQYADDPNVVAFFDAYNTLAQTYLDWFNQTPLSVYTMPSISGQLLDWVGEGVYGIARPVFASSVTKYTAGLNALPVNRVAVNGKYYFQSGTATIATDDFYKRTLTWWLYSGQSRAFDISLLRLRVARFLYGINGTDASLNQAQTVHIASGSLLTPGPPTLAQVAGGTFGARIYGARVSYVTPKGETFAGNASSRTVSSNNVLVVDSPPAENGATGYHVYAAVLSNNPAHFRAGLNAMATNSSAVNGTNKLAFAPMTRQTVAPIAIGTNWTEPASGLINGVAPPIADTSNPINNLIITVPASAAASSLFQQAMNQGTLAFPFQLTASVVLA